MKELDELRMKLASEEHNAAMLEQQLQEASIVNAQLAADKTALQENVQTLRWQ